MNVSAISFAQANSSSVPSGEGRVGINIEQPKATLHIKGRAITDANKAFAQGVIFPHITSEQRDNFKDVEAGTLIYNTTLKCVDLYDGTKWSCITTMATAGSGNSGGGTSGGGGNSGGGSGSTPSTGTQGAITGNVVLAGKTHYIASVKDNEYIPFVKPTQPATWETGETIGDDPLIDVQGTITTQGITIQIPITGSGTVGAYRQEVAVTAEKSKNNQAGILILEWSQQTVDSNSKFITAKLKAKDNDFHIKQLDLAKGLGNDYKGLVLANFTYKKDNTNSATETFTVRAISGIPDKKFGVQTNGRLEHQFIYLPIQGPDGKLWLNNNLGAEYANITSPYFSPIRQAGALDYTNTTANPPVLTNPTADQIKKDWRAYGYLYEWGRDSDGHEVINWISSDHGTFANPNKHNYDSTASNNPKPGTGGDPCPIGFHTPTKEEQQALLNAIGGNMWNERGLRLPAAGYRLNINARISNLGSDAWYWSSTEIDSTYSWYLYFDLSSNYLSSNNGRTNGHSVRCIAD